MKKASAISIRPAPLPTVYSVPEPQPLASCMPMPNTNAPMTSEGPSGAMAPPNPGTSAATGTTATAVTAISRKVPTNPPASPRVRKRRHAAVKLNSAVKKAMPSAKPSPIRPADAGWRSSRTSAVSNAAATTAADTNSQSGWRAIVAAEADPSAALARAIRLRSEAERFLQVVPLGALRLDGPAGIGGPFHHRAGVELHAFAPQHLGQDEPVGRRPMAGVAVARDRARRQLGECAGELLLRLQAVRLRVIEQRAVETARARDVPVGERPVVLGLAGEEGCGPRIDQRRLAGLRRLLDLCGARQQRGVER